MRFLHTTDWQMGTRAESVGKMPERVREERLAASQRVVQAARNHNAEMLILTGDVFDDNAADRVAEPCLGTVRLTDQFVPPGIQPKALTEAVELNNLPGGEQEQLFLITRLALGQVLAKDERQLVVLDDVLNATDTGRFARLLTVLEEAVDRLQIVILTCQPERYRALEQARFLPLQDLSNNGGANS